MNITIVGLGYVGLSLSFLLSRKHKIVAYDIDPVKVKNLKEKKIINPDSTFKKYLKNKTLSIYPTTKEKEAYRSAKYTIICTPTNYNDKKNSFDTRSVESAIRVINKYNNKTVIIIKSTVPLGFTEKIKNKYNKLKIIFSPEFLRETKSLHDNLYPSRIIVGDTNKNAREFANLLLTCSKKNKNNLPIFFMNSMEAEAVKLFSNSYLAMRVSFFNELDTFAESKSLSTKNIIEGISSDKRIGNFYNNPSFGYGGYCLPKDSKQLLQSFNQIPNEIIKAIIKSNRTRKNFIFNTIIKKSPKSVGIYRLTMKSESDNFRESSVLDIMKKLMKNKIQIYIYEPQIKENFFDKATVVKSLKDLFKKSDVIIANRSNQRLKKLGKKLYTRDIYGID